MREISSGTMASQRTCQPYSCAFSFSAGPPRSPYSPAAARSEIVMMPTVIGRAEWSDGVMECCCCSLTPLLHSTLGALRLLEQANVGDPHFLIHRFAHVIDGEQRD